MFSNMWPFFFLISLKCKVKKGTFWVHYPSGEVTGLQSHKVAELHRSSAAAETLCRRMHQACLENALQPLQNCSWQGPPCLAASAFPSWQLGVNSVCRCWESGRNGSWGFWHRWGKQKARSSYFMSALRFLRKFFWEGINPLEGIVN